MGFGHRIYKVRDPRADVLKEAVATLPATAGRLAYASEVEQGAIAALRRHKPGRRLDTNVEFYTALLLEALEIPRERLHRAVRRRPGGRLVRPCLRAGEGRPHHPAAIQLCRRKAAIKARKTRPFLLE